MIWIQSALFLLGLVLLVVGFVRNRRTTLLVAALTLFASAGLTERFVEGFKEGYREAEAAHQDR